MNVQDATARTSRKKSSVEYWALNYRRISFNTLNDDNANQKIKTRIFDRIMDIYSFARDYMAKNGNPNQWGPQKLVEKLGFKHCGTIYVEQDNYPRLAYEKSNKT